MKTIRKHFKEMAVVLLAALLTTSCMERLDIPQRGVTETSTYQTANDTQVEQFIAAVYAMILGDAFQAYMGGGPACYRSINSSLAEMSGELSDGFRYTYSAEATQYSFIWSYYYKQIYWCNMILENLPGNNVASASVKSQVMAEAQAIRAIAMMQLVQLWGNPPLADHIMDGSEGNTPASESWAFIEAELADAAEALPTKSDINGQAAIGGRLTKEAAYAYLGKAQLWQGKYNEAAQTLYEKVIATGKYGLEPVFDDLNRSVSDYGVENLWEFDFSENSEYITNQEGMFDVIQFNPTGQWYEKFGSTNMGWANGAYPSADYANFMKQHDGADSQRFQGTLMEFSTAMTMGQFNLPLSGCEGYVRVKDVVRAEDLVGTNLNFYSTHNVAYMRYAEVLLNYAEAVAMGGTPGAMPGLDALNLVRRRAGLTDAPALDMDNEEYGVKAERRAEFYWEGKRFIDLVRWGDAATKLADVGKQIPTLVSVNEDGIYNVTYTDPIGPGFQSGKNELFPIPQSDLNSNPNLQQNPGW